MHVLADLELGDGGSLRRALVRRVDDAEVVCARAHQGDAPGVQLLRRRLLLGGPHANYGSASLQAFASAACAAASWRISKGNPADLNRRGSTARQRGAKARSAEHSFN